MVNLIDQNIIVSTVIDFFLIFSPTIGYIAQLIKILKQKNSKGVSKLIPFLMITANILRIYFWIGKRFQLVFLLQSIVLVIMQLILLYGCIIYDKDSKEDTNLFNFKYFWNWSNLEDYLFTYSAIVIVLTIISLVFDFDIIYSEILGILSVIVETSVSIPQIIENYRVKSENNISSFLIFCWISGDILKVVINILKEAPIQLISCGFFQFFCDSFIVGQLCYYRPKSKKTKPEVQNNVI